MTRDEAVERAERRSAGKGHGFVTLSVSDVRALVARPSPSVLSEDVTPEMVEAGIGAWMDCTSTRTADILRATYLAMRSATSVESSGGTLNETDSSFNPAEDYCGIVEVDETDFRADEPVAKDGE